MNVAVVEREAVKRREPARELMEAWLAGRSPLTVQAYRRDLLDFTAYLGADSPERATEILLGAGGGQANLVTLRYRAALLERGLSPATINRKLSALRSVVKVWLTIGVAAFALDVALVIREPYRDTRG